MIGSLTVLPAVLPLSGIESRRAGFRCGAPPAPRSRLGIWSRSRTGASPARALGDDQRQDPSRSRSQHWGCNLTARNRVAVARYPSRPQLRPHPGGVPQPEHPDHDRGQGPRRQRRPRRHARSGGSTPLPPATATCSRAARRSRSARTGPSPDLDPSRRHRNRPHLAPRARAAPWRADPGGVRRRPRRHGDGRTASQHRPRTSTRAWPRTRHWSSGSCWSRRSCCCS